MFRFLVAFCLLLPTLCSIGCRMCCSPYDYCISAHIDRPDDFRGCGPLYRAGSILSGYDGMCQTDCGDITYIGNQDGFFGNAGNYGLTEPIEMTPTSVTRPGTPRPSEHYSGHPAETPSVPVQNPTLAKPQNEPAAENPIPGPYQSPNEMLPSVQDLLDQPRRDRQLPSIPESLPTPITPITPPVRPRAEVPTVDPSMEESPIETIPFSPNDEVMPPIPAAPEGDAPITLEELRRLDPSVSDLQIISIEDASTGSTIR